MPVFYGLIGVFGALGSGLVAYIRWFRPIKPVISLERLKSLSAAVSFERLREVTWPAVSIGHMTPAPMTLAPAMPTGPFKPIPIAKRPIPIKPIKITPTAMTPTEILERLKQMPAPPRSKILVESMKQAKRPLGLGIPLEQLKQAVKPPGPSISLWQLANVNKPAAPGISLKRPEGVVGLAGLAAALKRPKKKAKPTVETGVHREEQLEGVPEFLNHLREVVSRKTRRGKKGQD
jgi:hypothetical protein